VHVQGGKLFFMEHVSARTGTHRFFQRLFRWLWAALLDNCDLCRDTAQRIRAAGFTDVKIEEFEAFELTHPRNMMPGIALMRPHISGTATK